MTVNSPDRLDLTERLPKQGSIEASTPMMLEMVAVGAIAYALDAKKQNLSGAPTLIENLE